MTRDDRAPAERVLDGLQDIEDHLGELATIANAILPDLEQRFPGPAGRPADLVRDKELIRTRELLLAIARRAEHLASVVNDLAVRPPGLPPAPADERLVARLEGLATRAESSTPGLGL